MAISSSLTRGVTIAKNIYKELKPFHDFLGTTNDVSSRVMGLTSNAINTPGSFDSNNDTINTIKAIAKAWNNTCIKLLPKDENYWFEWSGVNLFDPATVEKAISKLETLRNKLSAVANSFSALVPIVYGLAATQGVADRVAYAYVPSLAGLEYIAVNQTITTLKAVPANATSIIKKLDNCIQTLQRK